MKTMEIPWDMLPFRVTINGVKYVYEAGTEQEVPDEVAEIIMNRKNDYPPKDREQEAPYKMPVATDTEPGAVMAGDGLVNNDGVLSVEAPMIPATANKLGGVKVGEGLAINVNGVLSVEPGACFPTAPTEDGTYVLKCVISGTSVTRSWVKEEE